MPNVINAEARFRLMAKLREPEGLSDDQFLIDEGLDFLSAYHSIKDHASRRLAMDFITQLAASQRQPKSERVHPLNFKAQMTYSVTIASTDGNSRSYLCAGSSDQQALIYAGKVVEANADRNDPGAAVTILKDGQAIGPITLVSEMIKDA